MNNSLENLLFFTKVLTGLIIFLNVALILSIRLNLKFMRKLKAFGQPGEATGSSTLAVLICSVMAVNALAIYGNHKMLAALAEMTAEINQGAIAPPMKVAGS